MGDRVHAIEREQAYYRVIGAIALALIIALSVSWLKDNAGQRQAPASQTVASPPTEPSAKQAEPPPPAKR
jgi:dCTP deaminase